MFHCKPSLGPVTGEITPPGSKSITNRALACAALATGTSTLRNVLACDDTQVMVDALRMLGLVINWRKDTNTIIIQGCGGQVAVKTAELFVANSGTTIRFLTAILASMHGDFILDGIERMQERPIEDLALALNELGANVQLAPNGCPPVSLVATGFSRPSCKIAGAISSQFLSGLLMAIGNSTQNVQVQLTGPLVSQPYITTVSYTHLTLPTIYSV